MDACAALFGGNLGEESFENCFGGKSALQLALEKTASFPHVRKIYLLACEGAALPALPTLPQNTALEVIKRPLWNNGVLLEALASLFVQGGDFGVFYYAHADSPFLDAALAGALLERHVNYPADYSYADGFPLGLTPEILKPGIAAVLRALLEKDEALKNAPVSRDSLFLALQKDINSFDIETEVSQCDLRPHRLTLAADSKRNLLLCKSFFDAGLGACANEVGENGVAAIAARIIEEKPALLRTLPAFFPVQVTNACPDASACSICPYAPLAKKADASTEMALSDFTRLIDKIVAFAGDAVIDLSLWGETALYSGRQAAVRVVLADPRLSLVIETSLMHWGEAELALYADWARAAAPRRNGMAALSWIVSAELPTLENPEPSSLFQKYFPEDSYCQLVRLKGKEDDAERFYRYWKGKGAKVIIQKYDNFAGTLPDHSTADLSPLRRHPCWHIMRDFPILIDGRVPSCREDVAGAVSLGNALSESLETIWERGNAHYAEHCAGKITGLCGKCDEWYTYNF